jgi:hypothetical protein
MKFAGYLDSQQLTTLSKLVDLYCQEYGISGESQREHIARCIFTLCSKGAIPLKRTEQPVPLPLTLPTKSSSDAAHSLAAEAGEHYETGGRTPRHSADDPVRNFRSFLGGA